MSDTDMDRLLEEGGFLAVSGRRAEGIPQDLREVLIKQTNEIAEYPLLPLRDTVIFPHMVTPLFVGRDRSLKAVEAAMATEGIIIVAAQKDDEVEEPVPDDIYNVGTSMSIARMMATLISMVIGTCPTARPTFGGRVHEGSKSSILCTLILISK